MRQTLRSAVCETPIGRLTLVSSDIGLRELHWQGRTVDCELAAAGESSILEEAARQLRSYFDGKLRAFTLPLDLVGTPFQVAAWRALAEIPYGTTVTYREQAQRLGRPRAVRAVGAANARNPLPIMLPCHRIIGSSGKLVGFGGGLAIKRCLLNHEAQVAQTSTDPLTLWPVDPW
jgi:methylated-DNA-[protein]-cysteine S-methyltransferase